MSTKCNALTAAAAALCIFTLSLSDANAQVARDLEPNAEHSEMSAARGKGSKRAADRCSGTVRDKRWYLSTSSPVTLGVIDVKADGTVRRQTAQNTKASSEIFGFKTITGGRLSDNAPVRDPDQPNRCFVLGSISIAGGHRIDLYNGFIAKGGGMISGNCTIDGLHETLCTLVRH